MGKMNTNLKIDVFHADEANVNAHVFSDDKGTFIVDCTRNSKEAKKVVELARTKGAEPTMMLITHGHPDHYMLSLRKCLLLCLLLRAVKMLGKY